MKVKNLTAILGFSLTLTSTLLLASPARSQKSVTFSCSQFEGTPTTVAHTSQHGDVPIIKWVSGYFAGSGFDNQTRCNKVSEKFQTYHNQGTLKYFTTGKVNGQPVICAVASKDMACNGDTMLFTLKQTSNMNKTLQQLIDVRTGASSQTLNETERVYIEFDTFLAEKAQQTSTTTNQQPSENSATQQDNDSESNNRW
ncbi:MAG: hypothetical protein Tsb0014_13680 [Pleurocapsa sp.]